MQASNGPVENIERVIELGAGDRQWRTQGNYVAATELEAEAVLKAIPAPRRRSTPPRPASRSPRRDRGPCRGPRCPGGRGELHRVARKLDRRPIGVAARTEGQGVQLRLDRRHQLRMAVSLGALDNVQTGRGEGLAKEPALILGQHGPGRFVEMAGCPGGSRGERLPSPSAWFTAARRAPSRPSMSLGHRQDVGDAVDDIVRARRPPAGCTAARAGGEASAVSARVSASDRPKTLPVTATPTVQPPPFGPSSMPTSVSSTLMQAQAGQTPRSSKRGRA